MLIAYACPHYSTLVRFRKTLLVVALIKSANKHTHTIKVCEQVQDRDPARKLFAKLYDIYHCCVYSKKKLLMMGTGTVRNM
jgi:hypothetical protein